LYMQCEGEENNVDTLAFKVDITGMAGVNSCALLQDWVYVIECPNGKCVLKESIAIISKDICNNFVSWLISKSSSSAKTAMIGKVGENATLKKLIEYDGWAKRKILEIAQKRAYKKGVGACQDFLHVAHQAIDCIAVERIESDIDAKTEKYAKYQPEDATFFSAGDVAEKVKTAAGYASQMMATVYEIFGTLAVYLDLGISFDANILRPDREGWTFGVPFSDFNAGITFKWNIGFRSKYDLGAMLFFTAAVRVVHPIRDGDSCNDWDTIAKGLNLQIKFYPKFAITFAVTCQRMTVMGVDLKTVAKKLLEIPRYIEKGVTWASNKIGEAINVGFKNFVLQTYDFITGSPNREAITEMQ
jgi:hypothetical protein